MVALAGLTTALSGLTSSAGSLGGIFSSLGGMLSGIGSAIKEQFGKAVDFLKDKLQAIKDWYNDNVQPIFDAISESASNAFSAVGSFIDTYLIQPFVGFFTMVGEGFMNLPTYTSKALEAAGQSITDFFEATLNAIDTYLIQPVAGFFTMVGKGFVNLGALVVSPFSKVGDIWDTYVTQPINSFIAGLANAWTNNVTTPISNGLEAALGIFDFTWKDILPDWSWDDIIPDSLSKFFSLDNLTKVFDGIGAMFDAVVAPIKDGINEYIIDVINDITKYELPFIGSSLRSLTGVGAIPQLAEGGIASGPMSGYPAVLHGTEAVVPLSGNRSIPVEMKGGGGGSNTFNITINPSGITDRTDKRELARSMGNMIQQEVARALGGTTMRGRM